MRETERERGLKLESSHWYGELNEKFAGVRWVSNKDIIPYCVCLIRLGTSRCYLQICKESVTTTNFTALLN